MVGVWVVCREYGGCMACEGGVPGAAWRASLHNPHTLTKEGKGYMRVNHTYFFKGSVWARM